MAYTEAFRTEALVRLAINQNDYDKTAEELGVAVMSLHNWERQMARMTIPELLDRAIEKLLANVPTTMPAKEWAIAIGILFDKFLLLQGEPTSRSETLLRSLGVDDPGEFADVIREAEAILAARDSGGAGAGVHSNGHSSSGEATTS